MTSQATPIGPKRGAGETRRLVKRRYEQGCSVREIATFVGVSTQAVYEHLKRLREAGELKEAS